MASVYDEVKLYCMQIENVLAAQPTLFPPEFTQTVARLQSLIPAFQLPCTAPLTPAALPRKDQDNGQPDCFEAANAKKDPKVSGTLSKPIRNSGMRDPTSKGLEYEDEQAAMVDNAVTHPITTRLLQYLDSNRAVIHHSLQTTCFETLIKSEIEFAGKTTIRLVCSSAEDNLNRRIKETICCYAAVIEYHLWEETTSHGNIAKFAKAYAPNNHKLFARGVKRGLMIEHFLRKDKGAGLMVGCLPAYSRELPPSEYAHLLEYFHKNFHGLQTHTLDLSLELAQQDLAKSGPRVKMMRGKSLRNKMKRYVSSFHALPSTGHVVQRVEHAKPTDCIAANYGDVPPTQSYEAIQYVDVFDTTLAHSMSDTSNLLPPTSVVAVHENTPQCLPDQFLESWEMKDSLWRYIYYPDDTAGVTGHGISASICLV